MNHSYAYLPNILNFIRCIWKARNDFRFDRKKHLPYQVQIVAANMDYGFQEEPFHFPNKQSSNNNQHASHDLPL